MYSRKLNRAAPYNKQPLTENPDTDDPKSAPHILLVVRTEAVGGSCDLATTSDTLATSSRRTGRRSAYPLDGIPVTSSAEIRIATSKDAQSALEYFAKLQAENLSTIFRVDPLPNLEEEVAFLRNFEGSPNSNWFAAVSDGAIVGNLGIRADSRAQRNHVGSLGMSILSPFRSAGLGTRLWETALSWAKSTDLRRIQLDVLETNAGAIRLYKRFGFSIDGRRPGDVFVAGDYLDTIQMSRAVQENDA